MNRVVENGTASRNRRIAQHRQAAVRALDQYCLEGANLTLLSAAESTVFRVDVPQQTSFDRHPYMGRIAGRKFVLRVANLEAQAATTRSELVWLAALLRDTSLTVPEPVPTRHGSLLAAATLPEDAEAEVAQCTLLRWVEGCPLDGNLEPSTLGMVGRYMAEMHAHSESFQPPVGFVRPSWNWERLCSAQSALHTPAASRCFSQDDLALFEAAGERVRRTMEQLGEGRNVFGLIHADLRQGNYLFHGDEARSIDFAGCGWGYYLFDIAITLGEWRHHPDYPAMRAAFLNGYRQLRPFHEEHEACIDTFMLARRIGLVNWILGWEDPTLKPWAPHFLEKSVEAIRSVTSET